MWTLGPYFSVVTIVAPYIEGPGYGSGQLDVTAGYDVYHSQSVHVSRGLYPCDMSTCVGWQNHSAGPDCSRDLVGSVHVPCAMH